MRLLALALLLICTTAFARDNGQWGEQSENVRQWFKNLMRPDFPMSSCCGEADAYWADSFAVEGDHYVAIITDHRDIPGRPDVPIGTRIPVPNEKMKWDAGNPTGHGVIFLSPYKSVYCYVAPGGT